MLVSAYFLFLFMTLLNKGAAFDIGFLGESGHVNTFDMMPPRVTLHTVTLRCCLIPSWASMGSPRDPVNSANTQAVIPKTFAGAADFVL